ncbi:MAG TPA: hypothetical protein VF771_13575, partial [Longimicrobiaceae bacterium]
LGLPRGVDPLATSREEVRALLVGARDGDAGPAGPHPGFRRTAAAFERLGVSLSPAPVAPESGVPEAHATWRAVGLAAREADAETAPLLDDASRLERVTYELGVFAPFLRAVMAGGPQGGTGEGDDAGAAFIAAPSIRLVRTGWDWDAFLADPALEAPPESAAAWVVRIPPSGALQMRRLNALPAMLLEIFDRPRTRAQAAAAVAERVEGDPARLAALVHAQIEEMRASGLLAATAAEDADAAVAEMRRLLLAEQAPPSGARSLAGLLARATSATREYTDDALDAAGDPYPPHLLDVSVSYLQQLLVSARMHGAFAAELDGYWSSSDVAARVRRLAPLLDVLGRALGGRAHALAPYLIAE